MLKVDQLFERKHKRLLSCCCRSQKVIKLVPEFLLKKRKAYQAIKATQAKLALLEKRKVGNVVLLAWTTNKGPVL